MLSSKYTEAQMTLWIRGTNTPAWPGRYQLRLLLSKEVVEGYFDGLRWKLIYQEITTPLSYAPSQIEWRGLNFEPKVEKICKSSGSFELVFDCRRTHPD